MRSSVPAAGTAYFLIVFAAGFVLGTLRTIVVAPRLGGVTAVIVEVPIMLLLAWYACGWVLAQIHVPNTASQRLAMGAIALGLLLMAEALVSVGLAGLSLRDHFRNYAQAAPLIGLAAQLLYAGFPLIRAHQRGERARG